VELTQRDIDVAWAAGLFEGEGYIVIHTPKSMNRSPYLSVGIGSTDEDVIQRFASLFSHGFRHVDYRSRDNENHKDLYRWTTQRAGAAEVVNLFMPFFSERRRAKALQGLEVEAKRVADRQSSLVYQMFGKAKNDLTQEEKSAYDREVRRRKRERETA
jgi:hypothetical protein